MAEARHCCNRPNCLCNIETENRPTTQPKHVQDAFSEIKASLLDLEIGKKPEEDDEEMEESRDT